MKITVIQENSGELLIDPLSTNSPEVSLKNLGSYKNQDFSMKLRVNL